MQDGLKRRLVGALVLLALAIIFLPGLFNRAALSPLDKTSQIPPKPEWVIEPVVVATADPSPSPAPDPEAMLIPAPGPEGQPPSVASDSIASMPANTAAPAVAKGVDSPVKTHAASARLNAQSVPHAWVLQLASLADEAKANQLRDRVIAAGHPAFVRLAETPKGRFYRVYIGPKIDKSRLLALKPSIDAQFQVQSLLLDMAPTP
jgi:DedD protein